jgi:hypothetical protein
MLLGSCVFLACRAKAIDFGGADDITAVSSKTSGDYVRIKDKDGVFPQEYYSFGEGGPWRGTMKDATIDPLTFLDVAHIIAPPLATQNYFPAKDPKTTKLLVMVYWGTTHAPEHASESASYDRLKDSSAAAKSAMDELKAASKEQHGAGVANLMYMKAMQSNFESAQGQMEAAGDAVMAENNMRDQVDLTNVKMLGYDSWWEATLGDTRGTALAGERQDLINEIEENRYFVVLMAYDFQLLWKEKKHKLLWEARFSIRQRHHEFDKDLPSMAQYASQYFGQDSHGLVHKAIPLGHVDIGELKSLGEAPAK